MATRSQYSASSMKWVVTMMVTPLRASPLMWVQNSRRVIGSTPEVGSSRNSTGGRCISEQANARRCLWPSGRESGVADSQSPRSKVSIISAMRSRRVLPSSP